MRQLLFLMLIGSACTHTQTPVREMTVEEAATANESKSANLPTGENRTPANITEETLQLNQEIIGPNETEEFKEFGERIQAVQRKLAGLGKPMRATHPRGHGCFRAWFELDRDRDAKTKFGLFADGGPTRYPAWVRFANAWPFERIDQLPDLRGIAVKVTGVTTGTHLDVLGESLRNVQDFLANDIPNATVPDARTLVELTEAAADGSFGVLAYLKSNSTVARILAKEAARRLKSSLGKPQPLYATEYFSGTPFRWGPHQAAKFIWKPCNPDVAKFKFSRGDFGFLHSDLKNYASKNEICFNLFAQFQEDPILHPIENSGVNWETESLYKVATLRLPRQNPQQPETFQICERMSFNPWRGLADHEPMGNTNRGRLEIYKASRALRQ